MIKTALSEFKDHLSSYVRKAHRHDVVITSHGRHVAVLTGFADEDDYLEYGCSTAPGFGESSGSPGSRPVPARSRASTISISAAGRALSGRQLWRHYWRVESTYTSRPTPE